jgi:hypothetical protein
MTDGDQEQKSWFHRKISVGKDLVSLLRDGTLLLILVFLLAFPSTFNSVLVSAGFQEGNIAGFKWKNEYIESNDKLETAQVTITSLKEKNRELLEALDEANARLNDDDLSSKIDTLAKQNQVVVDKARMVQATVSNTLDINTPYIQQALSSKDGVTDHELSDYLVGVQTLGVSDSERRSINDQLKMKGYDIDTISWSYDKDDRPSWFAYTSTVFYYSAASQKQAEQLSKTMKSITGQTFAVKRGAGLGVDPDKKDTTFFVHYIK